MSYEINTRQKALQAQKQAKPNTGQQSKLPELMKAIILRANGDGWDVATIDGSGNKGRMYSRVFSHPAEASFTSLDEVWLHIPASGDTPTILVAGGGGGSCGGGSNEFGVLFN